MPDAFLTNILSIRKIFLLCLGVALLFLPALAFPAPLFESDEVIDIRLSGPLATLIKNKKAREEFPFVLHTGDVELAVQVSARGKSRLRTCNFPPLHLKFAADADTQSVFSGLEKLKLVTHCKNRLSGEQNVLEEYLAYRIFNLFSETSFRVRLIRVTYTDTTGKSKLKKAQWFAFALEPKSLLAERSGNEVLEVPGVALGQLETEQTSLMYVFQYLIGNTDWSMVTSENEEFCCHNGQLLKSEGKFLYVPYDFDLAGMVNASYAKPDASLHLRSVRTRRYRGFCTDTTSVQSALRKAKSLETEVGELVGSIEGLTEADLHNVNDYLGQFFTEAQDEEKLLRLYERWCID